MENDLVQLYEPDDTPNVMLPMADAIEFCQNHPGWYWSYTKDGEE